MLSLTLSFFVFLWATLTFPRPPKAFWVLLIAYTQLVILFKTLSPLNLFGWNPQHFYMNLLGIQKRKDFKVFELFLLMVIFLHRAVLKMFGLWKTSPGEQFGEGNYQLEKCDDKTAELIQYSLMTGENGEVDEVSGKIYRTESEEKLIDDEEDLKQKALFKNELCSNYDENSGEEKKTLKAIYKDTYEIIKGKEDIFEDNHGKVVIKLRQGNTRMRLRPIDPLDCKIYAANELVEVETVIEEPFEFFPSAVSLAIKRYFYITRNFFEMIKPKHTASRKRVDVYKYMFFCDFLNFFVLLFGFTEFVVSFFEFSLNLSTKYRKFSDHFQRQTSSSKKLTFLNYIEENKIPTSLLTLIAIQFVMIIIDRLLYLRKAMICKVIFHIVTIFYVHIWMFFLLPIYFNRSLNTTICPLIYYFIKCFYMLLSAYQIRCGEFVK
jgi:piezo-type mechanosensitive ion channel component 1/2